jgi:hypothetical protein
MLVAGVVLMLVVAPVAFFGSLAGGLNLDELFRSASTVATGSTVEVDQSGTYIVSSPSGDAISCTLTGNDGTVLQLQSTDESSVAMGSGIAPGSYTLDCGASTGLVGMTGVSADQLTSAGVRAVMWSTVVGLIGLALVVVGIVMLVRVNRRRHDIQRQAWGGGLGGYGQGSGPGYGGRQLY